MPRGRNSRKLKRHEEGEKARLERERLEALRSKDGPYNLEGLQRNEAGLPDLTCYNGICLVREEPRKLKLNTVTLFYKEKNGNHIKVI
jgi:hypothetical protein